MNFAIELLNLSKYYPNGTQALKNVNLKVKNGDFYALLGPNGAGKSTIIGIVTSLIKNNEGTVKIFGYDLEKDEINAKKQFGLVPQEFNFNPFETVLQILINQAGYHGIQKKIAYIDAKKYLLELFLWDKRNELTRNLSGGTKRRLMIARSLIHNPKLLILDEPTAGVDIEARHSMWGFLKRLNENGTTIILTTHYLEEAEILCKNIGIIKDGRIIENTSIKNLLDKLESETFIFNLTPKSKIPILKDYKFKILDSTTLEIEVPKNKGLSKLFSQISPRGVQIISMRNKINRLEELFINLTKNN
ncbi:hypothetical protein AOQ88_00665 [Candidatus Riesia sp. GBBU]|nr:hypothetical protein AOQ88_00665 [Candidatus Riesia sp. GBBU]